jgi:8-oxo-dGTP pyrophosphatase MutT (NUDIX family)
MIEPWKTSRSHQIGDHRIFRLRSDERVSPRTGQPHEFFIIESVDWVNVIAVTPRQELVMVEQFRHGTETVELEIPGGMIDAEDGSPAATAARELREETGYEGDPARVIGSGRPDGRDAHP